ncbi:MAG: M15 family metallopeptidase [Crocinitomicaceae bacterium]
MIIIFFILQLFSCSGNVQEKSVFKIKEIESFKSFQANTTDSIPAKVQKLMSIYKEIVRYENNYIFFSNNTKIKFNDFKEKNTAELLENPDVEDMFYWKYSTTRDIPEKNEDAGRIRNETFFKALYGNTKEEVRKNLKSFVWCPKLVNQTILFNKKHGALEALKRISDELDLHPEWKKYITNIGGTFNWRNISGTNRLSAHSFGITIDINTGNSNYWQWDCGCKNEEVKLNYKNKIPIELVKIFEKNGFIWGGRWYHYDTMHFEYRPELITFN